MQIEQLEYIVSVMELRSFSKAGQALHISQSAISQSITKLENELGVKLFERHHNGVKPTEAGKQLVTIAMDVLQNLNRLQLEAEKYKIAAKSRLTIGIVSGLHLPILPKLLADIKREFPQQEIALVEKSSLHITECILKKEIDLGILVIYDETLKYRNSISFTKLSPIHFFVLVDPASPLAYSAFLEPKDITDQTFVMFNGEYMNWFFKIFNQQYGPLKLLFTTNNNENISETVRNGLAIAIETESEVSTNPFVKSGEILAIPLIEDVNKNSLLGMATLKNKAFSIENQKTMKYFEREISDLYNNRSTTIPSKY
ncbi:LysR family transcriptional regulator [Neobacillus sp. SAB-20_R2A]|uniref:LysR family transcriptional regulator n=1 Tax=Neobacillus sp. SAB-20_R2A TaxID=3120519 RepID=UPI003C6E4E0F